MNVCTSFTNWPGVGTPQWIGLDNYRRLLHDAEFWASFRHSLAMIVAMVVVPTLLGLLLAAVLFDYIGKRFGPRTASVLRAVLLPAAGAAGRGRRHRVGLDPAPRDGALNALLDGDRPRLASRTTGSATRTPRCSASWRCMVWVQIGYPVVIFMAGAAAGRPGAVRGGRDRRRRLVAAVLADHRAADPAGDLRRRC